MIYYLFALLLIGIVVAFLWLYIKSLKEEISILSDALYKCQGSCRCKVKRK
jgi:hypothetical protein